MVKNRVKKTLGVVALGIFAALVLFSCQNPFGGTSQSVKDVTASRALGVSELRAPSQNPPGGLLVEEAPMFVAFGWDDNGKSDGMNWALAEAAKRRNPAGTGNAATYDGEPLTMTFLNSSYYVANWGSESPVLVKKAWRKAYENGHEIGNHTNTHPHGANNSIAAWNTEIDACNSWLTNAYNPDELTHTPTSSGIGVPSAQIYGFRTPYLEYNDNLFQALSNRGWYDCSIEEGFEYDQDGTNFYWPYTLDAGSPGHNIQVEWGSKAALQNHPGLWEMPVYTFIVPPELRSAMKARVSWFDEAGGKITGFDYNLWTLFSMSKDEYLATLKYTLDLRLRGNRAPMLIGAHTDYYTDSYATPKATNAERRAAMQEFMDYAISKQDVRFVSFKKVLDWVKNPVALKASGTRYTISASTNGGGNISPAGTVVVAEGTNKTFYLNPSFGSVLDTIEVDGVAKPAASEYTFTNIKGNHSIKANFKGQNGVDPAIMKSTILSMVSVAENSSPFLVWNYAENINDGRGITFGICGFTSGTFDGTQVIKKIKSLDSSHPLVSYLPAFEAIDALPHDSEWKNGSTAGLENFIRDFNKYGEDRVVRQAQVSLLEDLYWNPAQAKASEIGAKLPITMGFLYDTCINHGAEGDAKDKGLAQLVLEANTAAGGTPKSGVNEIAWLRKMLDARKAYLSADPQWAGALDRIEMYRRLLDAGKEYLPVPLAVSCYQDDFVIQGNEVDLTFESVMYTVKASAGTGGFIAPSGDVRINAGATFIASISPDLGYLIENVAVDGVSKGAINKVEIANVREAHTVHATFKADGTSTYVLTASAGPNGSISPNGAVSVAKGASQTFALSPASSYQVDRVLVDGQAVALTGNSFTVANVQKSMAVVASFKKVDTPSYPAYDPAKVYNTGDIVSHLGKYWIAGWWTQGAAPGSTGEWGVWKEYQPINVNTYTLTSSAGANGSISPAGASLVNEGASQTFTMNPASGYMVEDVKVDGVSVGAVASYTLSNVKKNSTVVVTFKTEPLAVYWTITASAGANGSISPAGANQVKEGSNKTFTFNPASGYEVASVTVDGSPVTVVASYTFNNVRKASSIAVSFKVKTTPDVEAWVENKAYSLNDKVSHAGSTWICKYAHTSNSAWVPGTPGLWFWEKI